MESFAEAIRYTGMWARSPFASRRGSARLFAFERSPKAEEVRVREGTSAKEIELLARLRAGDEMAFASLVDDLHGPLLALARTFTSSRSLAEDIVQETWVAVIRGLLLDVRSTGELERAWRAFELFAQMGGDAGLLVGKPR